MLAFQQGDEESFQKLFRKYREPMIRFAHRFTGRQGVAEELAQDILVRCYLARESYQPTAKFSTWIFRIARNHCLNEIRRQRRQRPPPGAGALTDEAPASPEALTRASALSREIDAALAALPETQRTALILARFHGQSYEEIAAALETSLSAVKSLINRARSTLARRLATHLEAEDDL